MQMNYAKAKREDKFWVQAYTLRGDRGKICRILLEVCDPRPLYERR